MRLEHRVDRERVVVARRDDAAHVVREPLGGEVAPAAELLHDLLREQLLDEPRLLTHPLELILLRDARIEPVEVQPRVHLVELIGAHELRSTMERERVGPVALGRHRDHRLACDVPSEHERVSVVRLRRGEELAEAAIRAVHVRREEQTERRTTDSTEQRHSDPPPGSASHKSVGRFQHTSANRPRQGELAPVPGPAGRCADGSRGWAAAGSHDKCLPTSGARALHATGPGARVGHAPPREPRRAQSHCSRAA